MRWRRSDHRRLRARELRSVPLDGQQLARAHAELVTSLTAAIAYLRDRGEDHWAQELDVDLRQIQAGDGHGAARLLSHFGGMGSINDRMDVVPGLARAADLGRAVVATLDRERQIRGT